MGAPLHRSKIDRIVARRKRGETFKAIAADEGISPETASTWFSKSVKEEAIRSTPATELSASNITTLLEMIDEYVTRDSKSGTAKQRTIGRIVAERQAFGEDGPFTPAETQKLRSLLIKLEDLDLRLPSLRELDGMRRLLASSAAHKDYYREVDCPNCSHPLMVITSKRLAKCFKCGQTFPNPAAK